MASHGPIRKHRGIAVALRMREQSQRVALAVRSDLNLDQQATAKGPPGSIGDWSPASLRCPVSVQRSVSRLRPD